MVYPEISNFKLLTDELTAYAQMKHEYGAKKAKTVFYASRNKGTITGVDKHKSARTALSK